MFRMIIISYHIFVSISSGGVSATSFDTSQRPNVDQKLFILGRIRGPSAIRCCGQHFSYSALCWSSTHAIPLALRWVFLFSLQVLFESIRRVYVHFRLATHRNIFAFWCDCGRIYWRWVDLFNFYWLPASSDYAIGKLYFSAKFDISEERAGIHSNFEQKIEMQEEIWNSKVRFPR